MALSSEDKHVIKYLRQNKNYSARRLLKEVPMKGWTLGGLNHLIQKIFKLRQRIVKAWEEMYQRVIDEAVAQWRTRLQACVAAGGKHFEHLLH